MFTEKIRPYTRPAVSRVVWPDLFRECDSSVVHKTKCRLISEGAYVRQLLAVSYSERIVSYMRSFHFPVNIVHSSLFSFYTTKLDLCCHYIV